MKRLSAVRIASLIAVLPALLFLSSCQNSTSPGANGPTLGGAAGSITGKVVTTGNSGVAGIQVTANGQTGVTNPKGEFFIDNVPSAARVLVSFSGGSYAPTQKITEVRPGRTSYLEAAVLPIGAQKTVSAVSGGTVQFNSASVAFPANAFVDAAGKAFTGTATVSATWFDPTGPQFYGTFPGEFSGVRTDNSETSIESYGFVRVDLRGNGQALQLAPGTSATITFPIPAAQRGSAPQNIPLWWYDETRGKWIEEGSATRQGNTYVGVVLHFSSWNCDMPNQTSYLEGRVVDSNGQPLSFANVHSTGVDYTGSSTAHTNDDGTFRLAVKSGATARVWAKYYIISSPTQDVSTPATGQTLNIGTIVVPIDTANFCTIVGRIVDNGGRPVPYISLTLKDASGAKVDYSYTGTDGRFKFFGEAGLQYTLDVTLYQDSASNTKSISITCPSTPGVVNLGDISVDLGGATIIGRVVNASGNPVAGVNLYSKEGGANGSQGREAPTDSLGKFSLWVRPNKTFDVHLYYNQQSKIVSMTSGALGSTTDKGDIVFP